MPRSIVNAERILRLSGSDGFSKMLSSAVFTLTDPYEHQRAFRGNSGFELAITETGDYRGELKRLDFHQLWMQRSWQNLRLVAHTSLIKTRAIFNFLAHDRQPPMHILGAELSPADISVASIGDEFHFRSSAESCWASMSLTPDSLAAAGRVLIGRDIVAPETMRFMRPPSHLMSKLRNLHQAACDLATTAPEIFAHPEVSKALEQALIPALIACLSDDATLPSARGRQATVMRKFEELIEAEPDSPLYLMDICEKVDVTNRTLRFHCQEHLGMSPHRYLWLRRMTLARRRLMHPEPGATTVTEIATGCGFGELGRFAVQYHTLFGETPSETLRRSVG